MNIRDFIINVIASIILGFVIVGVIGFYINKFKVIKQGRYQTREETQEQVRYLRDSFEMEYYKKQLDSTYPFNHSKIPND